MAYQVISKDIFVHTITKDGLVDKAGDYALILTYNLVFY
jgi:hypothetical protein